MLEQVENELNGNKSDQYFSDFFSANPTDIKIIKIFDQLIRPFDELDDLIGDIDEKTKAKILLNSLYSSLQTHNPVDSMNETIELYRSMKGIKKVAHYISTVGREGIFNKSNIYSQKKNSRFSYF